MITFIHLMKSGSELITAKNELQYTFIYIQHKHLHRALL